MASSTANQPTAFPDVTIEYSGHVLPDTATFDLAKKLLTTHVGASTQTGAALGAKAIASLTPPVLDDPTEAYDLNTNFAEQQRFKLRMESVSRDRREWKSINSDVYQAVWA